MKYMLIMRSTPAAVAEHENTDFAEVLTAMGKYNEQMMNAGVMLDGEGLADAAEGAVVNFDTEDPVVTDGPYGEVHELFNGFWIQIGRASCRERGEVSWEGGVLRT